MICVDRLNLTSEEVGSVRKLYTERKASFDYLVEFGSAMEKVKALIIRDIALQG